jgi:hypothetical protein
LAEEFRLSQEYAIMMWSCSNRDPLPQKARWFFLHRATSLGTKAEHIAFVKKE